MTTPLNINTRMSAEERYLAQKLRDADNLKCMAYMNDRVSTRRVTTRQKKESETLAKKMKLDEIAGYGSIRYDFPEYVWWMVYDDGKQYYRSSNSWRVYDYSHSSRIVGTWNDETKKIEFL